MGLGLSLEITIPNTVDITSVISIGAGCYPHGSTDGMEIGEAVQWAFTHPEGIAALGLLGVTWAAMQTGLVI